MALLVIFGIIFSVTGPILIAYGFQLRDTEIKTMKGKLIPFKIDFQKLFEINLGSNICYFTVDQLDDEININRFVSVGYDYPIQIEFEDRKLLVSAEIKNEEGKIIAKIKDNHWVVNENIIIARDRNYNAYAFEVINSDLIPVFQIIVKEENKIYIGGLFYNHSGKVLMTPEGLFRNPSPDQIDENMEQLFRYPSEEHLGEMTRSDIQPIFRSTWVIIGGAFLTGLGAFFDIYAPITLKKPKKTKSRTRRIRKSKRKTQ